MTRAELIERLECELHSEPQRSDPPDMRPVIEQLVAMVREALESPSDHKARQTKAAKQRAVRA